MAGRKTSRSRSWTAVLYPESVPENWREIIDDEHIQWVESPLHDQDVNATGETKKDHWHILFMYESLKSYEQVKELTDKLNAPIPQICNGAKGLVRYMAHIDNPEKAQYSVSDIKAHGGADLDELLRPSATDRKEIIKDMITYIQVADITEFKDLMDYAMYNEPDWFSLLADNSAFVVSLYIKSNRHRQRA